MVSGWRAHDRGVFASGRRREALFLVLGDHLQHGDERLGSLAATHEQRSELLLVDFAPQAFTFAQELQFVSQEP